MRLFDFADLVGHLFECFLGPLVVFAFLLSLSDVSLYCLLPLALLFRIPLAPCFTSLLCFVTLEQLLLPANCLFVLGHL